MKKCIRGGDPQRRRYWEEVLRRWREGGQSVSGYCRAEGLRESAFYFWRRKLAGHGARAEVGNGARRGRRPRASDAQSSLPVPQPRGRLPSFLPVRVVERGATETTSGVEIVLEQRGRVRVMPGFDRQTLADVLAVLEVRPC